MPRRQLQHAERWHGPARGQHADYLYVALKSYKVQNQHQLGRSNGVMSGQAKNYTNPEIKELASYISSLPGELKTVPESLIHDPVKFGLAKQARLQRALLISGVPRACSDVEEHRLRRPLHGMSRR